MQYRVDKARVRVLKPGAKGAGPMIYWMSRDQRTRDNWALLYAQDLARAAGTPLAVVFCLAPSFLDATARQYGFMLKGLEQTARSLNEFRIPFFLLTGDPATEIPGFIQKQKASALVTDFDPLRIKRTWKARVAKKIVIPFYEVDAHNIVPCWVASPKQEYGAYTLRPKLLKLLPDYLVPIPALSKQTHTWPGKLQTVNWQAVRRGLRVDHSVHEVSWLQPGEQAARKALSSFSRKHLQDYDKARNDPNQRGQSNLSPYLHFGQLSAQRVALEVLRAHASEHAKEAFLEEVIIRRELSDNFCFYRPDYDSTDCFPDWAKKSLARHRRDAREYVYTKKNLEEGRTHDELWNAAQQEMVFRGKMHGYLRMYWAKKILEWTRTPEHAMRIAIQLNDTYELDGRDPNGYTGIAWCIGGLHDRAWGERKIFGKLRFMSYNGCASKFDVKGYIATVRAMIVNIEKKNRTGTGEQRHMPHSDHNDHENIGE
jgi:deoxyribodipyrimidine photo-lyase